MDAAAILAFLNGGAPEMLTVFADGVIVSEVTLKTLEWNLVRAGVKRLEVIRDLSRLGLEDVTFSERQLSDLNAVLALQPGLDFEVAVAAGLARATGSKLISGHAAWHGIHLPNLELQLVGSARMAVTLTPAPHPVIAVTPGVVSGEPSA